MQKLKDDSRRNAKRKLFGPTSALVAKYVTRWRDSEKSKAHADALSILFLDRFKLNNSIEHVLIKVSALNDFYATRILDTFSIAKHVFELQIDDHLNKCDLGLVDKIRHVRRNEKSVDLYSFASKYCSLHRPDQYPMWDSYVDRMLRAYRRKHNFSPFVNSDLKNYRRFIVILKEFQSYYQLEELNMREIDVFLWLYGKECFPRKIKAKAA
jgi:hypothetical protein